jgi:DnaK suppressor protein
MARREALLRLHKTLSGRRQELRKRLGMGLKDLRQSDDLSGDAADAAFGAAGEELASQLAELEAKELAKVERALVRLKQGKYGQCDGCDAKIPVARLEAQPYSTLCIQCQRESERDNMWFQDRGLTDWNAVSDGDEKDVRISDYVYE